MYHVNKQQSRQKMENARNCYFMAYIEDRDSLLEGETPRDFQVSFKSHC
jgi:hypothetical protein